MSQDLERGIAELKRLLGDFAYQLKSVKTKLGEAAAFSCLLPPDYKDVRRTLRISFPDEFPYELLKFTIAPSAFQIWPHVMIHGVCLFAANHEPATTSPEEAVTVAMHQLIKLIKFSLRILIQWREKKNSQVKSNHIGLISWVNHQAGLHWSSCQSKQVQYS